MLLTAGADVNAQGGRHSAALHAALRHGREEIVKMLVAAGADLNAQDRLTVTALQGALLWVGKSLLRCCWMLVQVSIHLEDAAPDFDSRATTKKRSVCQSPRAHAEDWDQA